MNTVMKLLLCLLVFSGTHASADELQYGGQKFADVCVTQTDRMYYIMLPDSGAVISLRKSPDIESSVSESPSEEREILHKRFQEKFYAKKQARRAEENKVRAAAEAKKREEERVKRDLLLRQEAEFANRRRRLERIREEEERQAREATPPRPSPYYPRSSDSSVYAPSNALGQLHTAIGIASGSPERLSEALDLNSLDARAAALRQKKQNGTLTAADLEEGRAILEGYRKHLE